VGGTGLGLAISMEDARLHGGTLNAWGRPGQGAQFRLTIPRTPGGLVEVPPLPVVPRDILEAQALGGGRLPSEGSVGEGAA
jgi:two-component system sensor histidine kinase MtrB